MLPEQTMEKLYAMKLNGVAEAWEEQRQQPHSTDLNFDDRLALLVERQWIWKENRALATRLKYARLRQAACLEDVDFRHPRGLKRATIDQLASCEWLRHHRNCLITGPTGVGKSYLACALAHKACREGFRALYYYVPKLFRELAVAQADGSLTRLLKKLARADLLIVDDWGLSPLKPDQYRLFLEILDDRQGNGATLITSQYPVNTWHELAGDPTVGDAILDRLVHNAHKLELKGDSLRKKGGKT
jgi:DNA replication protein DnaC